ncbi:Uncharacterised protein [Streptococcus pneumoniae]|nr:Uncharacterised protein [Streptococcus pneumoniae]
MDDVKEKRIYEALIKSWSIENNGGNLLKGTS